MKPSIIKTALLLFACFFTQLTIGQTMADEIKKLNEITAHSLYNSSFSLNEDGLITRTINSERSDYQSFRFYLKDIKDIGYASDGFHNVIIKFKKGKGAKSVRKDEVEPKGNSNIIKSDTSNNGTTIRLKKSNVKINNINVIAFRSKEHCEKVIEIFKNIVALYEQNK